MSWNASAYNAGKQEGRALVHSTIEEIREYVLGNQSVSEFGLGLTHGAVDALVAMHQEIEAAKLLVEREMSGEGLAAVTRLIGEEMAQWVLDPHVDGVVGLCGTGTDKGSVGYNTAYLVVYLNGTTPDWETTSHFEDAMEGRI